MARKLAPPKTIRLAGRTFKLNITKEKFGNKGEEHFGLYEPFKGIVNINATMSTDQQKATVVHEVLHDFDMNSGYDLGEKRVNTLGGAFFAWMRDNPELVKWIMQE